ncbi:MAG: hypothetical protein Q9187_004172 [Circinaria calcarea]
MQALSATIRRQGRASLEAFPRAGFSSRAHRSLRKPPHQRSPTNPPKSSPRALRASSTSNAVSDALKHTKHQDNSLLVPVHIPEDPDGVLNEKHPAATILANSAIVVQRELEMMNIMIGFEQANRYIIMDPQGNHLGYMAEQELGTGNILARQMFKTHRSFTTHVFDKRGKEVLRFHRPFAYISSRIRVYDPLEVATSAPSSRTDLHTTAPRSLSTDVSQNTTQVSPLALSEMRIIGEAQQYWHAWRRKYNLFLHRSGQQEATPNALHLAPADLAISNSKQLQVTPASSDSAHGQYDQFAYMDEPLLSWDFSLLSADSKLIGSVNRNFAGFGREIFTDTGVYALRMDAAGPAAEPRHLISKTGQTSSSAYETPTAGMSLDQRAVMLATAVSVDFDYFSRQRTGALTGFMPLWFPVGGEAVAGAAAGEVEAGTAGAVGGVARGAGAGGLGEGAVIGAGSVAGYDAMQRGRGGDDASPTANGPDYGAGQATPPDSRSSSGQGEDVWGEECNPWGGDSNKPGGGGPDGADAGGGGGDVGGGFDIGDWF